MPIPFRAMVAAVLAALALGIGLSLLHEEPAAVDYSQGP
jgi:hypothetical protein